MRLATVDFWSFYERYVRMVKSLAENGTDRIHPMAAGQRIGLADESGGG